MVKVKREKMILVMLRVKAMVNLVRVREMKMVKSKFETVVVLL